MFVLINLIVYVVIVNAEPIGRTTSVPFGNETLNLTRRILRGHEVGETRPYMVYLRGAPNAEAKILESNWLCGGVIIHERYILTSAACIEDAKHFYVVSGTSKWVSSQDKGNECVNNGAKKAVWKCVPKAYYFDGDDFDNLRWMVGDIAVVKVEDNFNFERRIRGCDFIPKKVDFNNRSIDLEKAGTVGSIAGWGTREIFGDGSHNQYRSTLNSPDLMETDVVLVSKKNCKKRWEPRYHFVIDEHMICTKDVTEEESMSNVCSEREVNCKELVYSDEDGNDDDDDDDDKNKRRMVLNPTKLEVHTAVHLNETRRTKILAGGFCENDHGGPLIVGQGKSSVVVGVMAACLTRDVTRKCYGPFLYTSVYHYRNLITCAIDKDLGPTCKRLLRSSKTPMYETFFDWSTHSDGKFSVAAINLKLCPIYGNRLGLLLHGVYNSIPLPNLTANTGVVNFYISPAKSEHYAHEVRSQDKIPGITLAKGPQATTRKLFNNQPAAKTISIL